MLQAPRCWWMLTWLSWHSATMMHATSGNSQALGQELGLVVNSSYFGEGGYLHGSPSTEPPLMHAARGTLQAWEQVLGLVIPGFRGAPHPIWMGRAIDWALLGIVLHPCLSL
ncbi:hypothetical protein L208DRAFT_1385980 [Tricholoma matsutake]|nr:hypothetical protein L208DRAFT_1385980 [Tricholoma matsutake 945]